MARQHPGPAFERDKEAAARAYAKECDKDPEALGEEVPECNPTDLDSIRDEAAVHLGRVYYAQARLKAGVRNEKLADKLTDVERISRARHDQLMALAGRAIASLHARG